MNREPVTGDAMIFSKTMFPWAIADLISNSNNKINICEQNRIVVIQRFFFPGSYENSSASKGKSTRKASANNNKAESAKTVQKAYVNTDAALVPPPNLLLTSPPAQGKHKSKQDRQGRCRCSTQYVDPYLRGRTSTQMQCVAGLHVYETRE